MEQNTWSYVVVQSTCSHTQPIIWCKWPPIISHIYDGPGVTTQTPPTPPEEGCLCVVNVIHPKTTLKHTQKKQYKNTKKQKYEHTKYKKNKNKTQTLHLRGFMACSNLLNCLTPHHHLIKLNQHPHPTPHPRRLKDGLLFRYCVVCALMLGINNHKHVALIIFKRSLIRNIHASHCALVWLFSAVGCEQK